MPRPNNTTKRYQYFDRAGHLIPEEDAVDHRGILKDGVTARVPVMLRDDAASHRPGFRISDASNDEREEAWLAMVNDAANAWRHGNTSDENDDDPQQHDHKPMTLDAARKHHAEVMAEVYAARDAELRDAWKHGK